MKPEKNAASDPESRKKEKWRIPTTAKHTMQQCKDDQARKAVET